MDGFGVETFLGGSRGSIGRGRSQALGRKVRVADSPDVYGKEQFIGPNPLWDPQLAKLAGIAGIKLFGLVAIQLDKA